MLQQQGHLAADVEWMDALIVNLSNPFVENICAPLDIADSMDLRRSIQPSFPQVQTAMIAMIAHLRTLLGRHQSKKTASKPALMVSLDGH